MKKQNITLNGFIFWNRSYKGMVFARQLEPTEGLYGDIRKDDPLVTPILVGRDGEYGRDLIEILEENEKLKKQVEEYEKKKYNLFSDLLEALDRRVTEIEIPWWKRLFRRA